MFKKHANDTEGLQTLIDQIESKLLTENPISESYNAMTDQLTKLYAIKSGHKPDRISKDQMALIAANLLGIAVIVGTERSAVLSQKAFSIIRKLH